MSNIRDIRDTAFRILYDLLSMVPSFECYQTQVFTEGRFFPVLNVDGKECIYRTKKTLVQPTSYEDREAFVMTGHYSIGHKDAIKNSIIFCFWRVGKYKIKIDYSTLEYWKVQKEASWTFDFAEEGFEDENVAVRNILEILKKALSENRPQYRNEPRPE